MNTREWSWKMYLLLICQILGLFSKILAVSDKYPVLNRVKLTIPVEMQLSEKQKLFSEVFFSFLSSSLNFDFFERKDDAHRFCISKITDCQNAVRSMSKRSRFREPMDKQDGKWVQALFKSLPQHLYHIYWSLLRPLNQKTSLLLTCQTFRLFPNMLAGNGKYPVLNSYRLMIPIKMQLYEKKNLFSIFFSIFQM